MAYRDHIAKMVQEYNKEAWIRMDLTRASALVLKLDVFHHLAKRKILAHRRRRSICFQQLFQTTYRLDVLATSLPR